MQKSKSALSKDDLTVKKSLGAFENIGEASYYPTIFLERGNLNYNSKTDIQEKTFLAVEDETEFGESISAYEIIQGEQDDALDPLEEALTPVIVAEDNLFVIELAFAEEENFSNNTNNGVPPALRIPLSIDKMTIRDLKEGWPFRSEISIKPYKYTSVTANSSSDCGEGVSSSVDCYSGRGNRIVQLKRSWEDDERIYNWDIENPQHDNTKDVIFYIIFEADTFPLLGKEEILPLPNGSIATITYTSWQSIYDKQTLSMDFNNTFNLPYAKTFSVDKSGIIKYNLK